MSVKATKASEDSCVMYEKASILKSYTGSVSRPATILFVNNTPVEAYCGKLGKVQLEKVDCVAI